LRYLQQTRGEDHVQADLLTSGNVKVIVVENDERQRDGVEVAHDTEYSNEEVHGVSWGASVFLLPRVVVAHPVGFERTADQHVPKDCTDQVQRVERQSKVDGELPTPSERSEYEAAVKEEDRSFGCARAN
jgi:hypothetical protein